VGPTSEQGRPARGRPARYTQDDLLHVVAQVFNDRGYEAASMADLARASGLTKSSFYHHVSGKEELLRLAVDRALDALSGVFDEETQARGRPVDRLERVLRRTAEILVAELPYVTVLLRVRGNTVVERDAVARRRAFDARLATLVQAAADAGEVRDDSDPRLASRLLFGMVNSISEWYRPDAAHGGQDDVVRAVVELALGGLRARPA
jgi:AcrR family transcriptional regulator